MAKYYLYSNNSQAYEALTYNDFLCYSLRKENIRTQSFSVQCNNYLFITRCKITPEERSRGVAYEQNRYPVTFELEGFEEYKLAVRFVSLLPTGEYHLEEQLRPIEDYPQIPNCIGAFVFGHLPFSLVTGIIFESEKDKDNFNKSGSELWFPEDLYHLWQDPQYADQEVREFDYDKLHDLASQLDKEAPEEDDRLLRIVQRINHKKAAYYLALEATQNWTTGKLVSNIDSAIITIFDTKERVLAQKVDYEYNHILGILGILPEEPFCCKDEALEEQNSTGCGLFKLIQELIGSNESRLDQTTTEKLLEKVNNYELACELAERDKICEAIEDLKAYQSTRVPKNDLLNKAKEIPVLYAYALCIKNKNQIDNIRNEVFEDQKVRRYAFMIAGLQTDLSCIEGRKKNRNELDRRISDIAQRAYLKDASEKLIRAKYDYLSASALEPKFRADLSLEDFENYIMNEAEDGRLRDLYFDCYQEKIEEKEIQEYKKPIVLNGELEDPLAVDRFIKELQKKRDSRKTEFSARLLKMQLKENPSLIKQAHRKFCE